MAPHSLPNIIYGHSSTWHDGNAAVLLSSGQIFSLASERVGERVRHDGRSEIAYRYLKERLFPDATAGFVLEDQFEARVEADLSKAQHHRNHAASAFFGSGFANAAVLVIDGQGPQDGRTVSTSLWRGADASLEQIEIFHSTEDAFQPCSLGHFYTAISALCGMQMHEEGKTMGLAAYGKPSRYLEYIRQFAYPTSDGRFHIAPEFIYAVLGNTFGPRYYDWPSPRSAAQRIWDDLLAIRGGQLREGHAQVTQDDMDIAFAGQTILEEIMLTIARYAKVKTGSKRLCLAGGVALNCSANGALAQSKIFDAVYVFPAADDSGQAIGRLFDGIRGRGLPVSTVVGSPYLGPEYTQQEIEEVVRNDHRVRVISSDAKSALNQTADLIADGKVVGTWQGRSEIGPRALGNRSILADPRRAEIRDHINARIKRREWYRPLAPAILIESVDEYFVGGCASPFMTFTMTVRPEKWRLIPAVVHVDGTARVQAVEPTHIEHLHRLIKHFEQKTTIPVLLNTSFNLAGGPLVETPQDAINAFCSMDLDLLALGHFLLERT
ncbi:carbamoyltransferase [Bradyrhizobium diazoefficiens]